MIVCFTGRHPRAALASGAGRAPAWFSWIPLPHSGPCRIHGTLHPRRSRWCREGSSKTMVETERSKGGRLRLRSVLARLSKGGHSGSRDRWKGGSLWKAEKPLPGGLSARLDGSRLPHNRWKGRLPGWRPIQGDPSASLSPAPLLHVEKAGRRYARVAI